jgi:hypothetical protein
MQRKLSVLAVPRTVLAFGLMACHTRVPEQAVHRPAPVATTAPVSAPSGRWAYRPAAPRRVYTLEQRAQLTIRQDTIEHSDSVMSRVVVAFMLTGQGSTVTGTVSEFGVRSAGHGMTVPPGVAVPFPFSATYEDRARQLSFIAPSAAPCVTPALPIAHSLRDLWFQAPDTLWLGRSWNDSTSYASCRDGIPLRTAVLRAFRVSDVAEHDGHVFLTVHRTSSTTIEGDGAQSGEPVSITGSGTGELAYMVDVDAGQILSARGTSILQVVLRSKFRTQTVRQTSDIRIDKGS